MKYLLELGLFLYGHIFLFLAECIATVGHTFESYWAHHFFDIMAGIAQLVEPRIVIPVVAGSSPVSRPTS